MLCTELDSADFNTNFKDNYARFDLGGIVRTNRIVIKLIRLDKYIHVGEDDVFISSGIHPYEDDYDKPLPWNVCETRKINTITTTINPTDHVIKPERGLYPDIQYLLINLTHNTEHIIHQEISKEAAKPDYCDYYIHIFVDEKVKRSSKWRPCVHDKGYGIKYTNISGLFYDAVYIKFGGISVIPSRFSGKLYSTKQVANQLERYFNVTKDNIGKLIFIACLEEKLHLGCVCGGTHQRNDLYQIWISFLYRQRNQLGQIWF
jgi:hypothetical protein